MENEKKFLLNNAELYYLDSFLSDLFDLGSMGHKELSRDVVNDIKKELETLVVIIEEGLLKGKLQQDQVYLSRIQSQLTRLSNSIQDLKVKYYIYDGIGLNSYLVDSRTLTTLKTVVLGDLVNTIEAIRRIINNEKLIDNEKVQLIDFFSERVDLRLSCDYKKLFEHYVQKYIHNLE